MKQYDGSWPPPLEAITMCCLCDAHCLPGAQASDISPVEDVQLRGDAVYAPGLPGRGHTDCGGWAGSEIRGTYTRTRQLLAALLPPRSMGILHGEQRRERFAAAFMPRSTAHTTFELKQRVTCDPST